jgi:hypothetical protein
MPASEPLRAADEHRTPFTAADDRDGRIEREVETR